jgi:hypothetical protein
MEAAPLELIFIALLARTDGGDVLKVIPANSPKYQLLANLLCGYNLLIIINRQKKIINLRGIANIKLTY